jgi:hypothetical protein
VQEDIRHGRDVLKDEWISHQRWEV